MARPVSVTHSAPACNEQALVAAVRCGDDRAFEELFSRYSARIESFVLGMVRDHGRAEDLVQEVFISALRRLRDTQRPVAFKPWIYEIARNACIDEFRRTRRTREVPLDGDQHATNRDRDMASPQPTPDDAVESKQRLEDLRGAFRGLSESHHRILVLREFEGLSYSEIGERMGMSRPVVESTLFRARRRLSEEYKELESGRRCRQIRSLVADASRKRLRLIGVRERRQLARHLAHCQSCRREAWIAGLHHGLYRTVRLDGRVTFAPLQVARWRAPDDAQRELAAAESAA